VLVSLIGAQREQDVFDAVVEAVHGLLPRSVVICFKYCDAHLNTVTRDSRRNNARGWLMRTIRDRSSVRVEALTDDEP
jgi:hypothetical protein